MRSHFRENTETLSAARFDPGTSRAEGKRANTRPLPPQRVTTVYN